MRQAANSKVKDLLESGEMFRAERHLRRQIAVSKEPSSKQRLVSELIHVHVRQSRYKEAYIEAEALDLSLRYRKVPFFLTLLAALTISIVSRLGTHPVVLSFYRLIKSLLNLDALRTPYTSVEGVLWGIYWQDMRRALHANVLCVLLADGEDSRLRSLAFLNYTLAYQGWSVVGISGMKHVISVLEVRKDSPALRDLLVWLAVAYQMGSRPKECLATHERLAAAHSDAEAFFHIISFASRLHMSATELGPTEAAAELDKSFSGAFALKESRNHIQIYGTKAALLALEGREEEAISFLDKAELTAKRNENRLDNLIFHRFAAITYLNLKDFENADRHISNARTFLRLYADVALYRHELARLDAVSANLRNPGTFNRFKQILRFFLRAIVITNTALQKKTIRLTWQFLMQDELSYWSMKDCSSYLRARISRLSQINQQVVGEKISLNLTRALLKIDFEKAEQLGPTDLLSLVREIFPAAEVLVGISLDDCLRRVKKDFGLGPSFILNDESDYIRARCEDGRYFVAVQTSNLNFSGERIAVGILVSSVDFVSQEMIETSLRITLTLYQSLCLSFNARQERLTNQHQIEIAKLAAQVAHDIRSPLSALTMLTSFVPELSDEKRALVRDASRRISDIANQLLKKSKEKLSEISACTPVLADVLIVPLVESIVSEKRSLVDVRTRVDINFEGEHPFGLFARLNATELQRALSNVLNNAIEAIDSNGKVTVSLRADDRIIQIRIADTGVGMSESILAKIGERGFSFGKKNESAGFGLGLHHARKMLDDIGGRLTISSEFAVGTTVCFEVPRSTAPSWFASEIPLSAFQAVWLIDDDDSIHSVWLRRFTELNVKVPMRSLRSGRELIVCKENGIGDLSNTLLLVDCDFDGEAASGLDIIISRGLQAHSILVTSRCIDAALLKAAAEHRVKILPKSEMHLVAIH